MTKPNKLLKRLVGKLVHIAEEIDDPADKRIGILLGYAFSRGGFHYWNVFLDGKIELMLTGEIFEIK